MLRRLVWVSPSPSPGARSATCCLHSQALPRDSPRRFAHTPKPPQAPRPSVYVFCPLPSSDRPKKGATPARSQFHSQKAPTPRSCTRGLRHRTRPALKGSPVKRNTAVCSDPTSLSQVSVSWGPTLHDVRDRLWAQANLPHPHWLTTSPFAQSQFPLTLVLFGAAQTPNCHSTADCVNSPHLNSTPLAVPPPKKTQSRLTNSSDKLMNTRYDIMTNPPSLCPACPRARPKPTNDLASEKHHRESGL